MILRLVDDGDMNTLTPPLPARRFDADEYRLVGGAGERAQAAGLVNADWTRCAVPRATMKTLMQRADLPAVRDTLLWYALIAASGLLAWSLMGSWWALPAFALYGALYCGPADSRWHEAGHGTAFKTRWMNDVLYQLASFQVLRRPTAWRWSHARHHTDTLVTGRDPEIAFPVPPSFVTIVLNLFAMKSGPKELTKVLHNAIGRISDEDKSYIPEMEWPKLVREARAWLVAYAAVIAVCMWIGSASPLLFVIGPSFYGAWLYNFFGATQHAGLPENVLDHRLNCRTVRMNPVFRFLYWNMNYHVEHHMFPMVPFHALPQLHEAIKADCPPVHPSTWAAYRELVPALWRQRREPGFAVQRVLPGTAGMAAASSIPPTAQAA